MLHRFVPHAYLLSWLLGLSVLSASTEVHASGLALPTLGPTNSGVSTTGPTSVHYNPAGLGFARKLRLVIGGNLLVGSLRYQRDRRATYQRPDSLDYALPIEPEAIDPDKSGLDREVKATPIGVVPALFFEAPIGKLPLALGFGIDAPYAAIVRWPGAGPQRFALDDATLASVFVNAAIAYRPTDWLSLGVGVSYVLGYGDLSRTQDLATVKELGDALARPPISQANGFGPDANPALRELNTFARPFEFNNGWAHGFTFRAGAMVRAGEHVWLSASYEHSTRLDYRGSFSLDMDDPFFTQDLASQGLDYPAIVRGDASLSLSLPRVVRAGIRYTFGKKRNDEPASSIALEGSYTGWSAVQNFDVRLSSPGLAQPALGLGSTLQLKLPRGWYDTFGGVLRATHALTEGFMFWGSVGVEGAAVPDRTIDAASPDGLRITGAGGFSVGLTRSARLLLDLTYQHVLERNVKGSDYDLGNGRYNMFLVAGGAFIDYTF
jgi:long-chain fatty acid transport protein